MRKKNPIDKVEWVDPMTLAANDYNPNTVFTPEFKLLRLSLLETGWTQPIVAGEDRQIIDGFHRWKLACTDSKVKALGGGKVPVVFVENPDRGARMLATVRHNRARGVHGVLPMADIVRYLKDVENVPFEKIGEALGMEAEEVDRLYDHAGMTQRGSSAEFGKAWMPDASSI